MSTLSWGQEPQRPGLTFFRLVCGLRSRISQSLTGHPNMDAKARTSSSYHFGPYYVDAAAGQLRKHGVRLRLAGQPFDILVMLLERAGQVVTREEIQERLWSHETFVDFENSLNKAINKLRQALSDSPEKPTYIETLPRRGYRFLAEVRRVEEKHAATEKSGTPERSPLEEPAREESRSKRGRSRWRIVALA